MNPPRASSHLFLRRWLFPLIVYCCITAIFQHRSLFTSISQDDDDPSIDIPTNTNNVTTNNQRSSSASISIPTAHNNRLPSPCNVEAQNPAVSFVFAGRNDNYVGIYERARTSLSVLLNQLHSIISTAREDYAAEILIVRWGHDPHRPSLYEEVVMPVVESLGYNNNDDRLFGFDWLPNSVLSNVRDFLIMF